MTENALLQLVVYLLIIALLVQPLGWYMALVYEGRGFVLDRFLGPFERLIYRICRIDPKQSMNWKEYLIAMLIFNALGIILAYLLQRLQPYFPLNPQHLPAPSPYLAFNTAISFATNTDWQAYSGEGTFSYFTQMTVFTTQNFLSAATGMSLLVALCRGLGRQETKRLGNFWVDSLRGILYILLPLSLLLALALTSQGVIQNLQANQPLDPLQTSTAQQIIPMGPVASQVAIKQLGTNGGGFFNTNAAHPFENPTPLSNFLEMLAILLIPAALCYTFGLIVNDKRQSWALLAAMYLLFVPFVLAANFYEQQGNPQIARMEVTSALNMEGKETRFGVFDSALWAVATTATSNGSVNSMLDSYTALGGLVPLWMMHLGEVVFGGTGSGLYSLLMFVVITVFIAGLMVGRTPEYLGKKIEPFEMKMASLVVLIMPLIVLLTTAAACLLPQATKSIANPGAHGLTEMLYAFTSMGNNNGSAFAGLEADTPFYNLCGSLVMLISRYWMAIPALAIAGSLGQKKRIATSSGTLATHRPLFVLLLISVILLLGALSFLPVLALGPIVEHLLQGGLHG